MFDLTGKTAWVTGSTRNLGFAMLRALASRGANVVVSNRQDKSELHRAVAELRREFNVTVFGVQLDITDQQSVAAAVRQIEDAVGPVDILVNNAAIRPFAPLHEVTLTEWNNVLAVNLTGAFLCTQAVVPGMKERRWGRIINIGGQAAYTGRPNRIHAVTSKAGIVGFTRALAQELAPYGITANCIVPGVFRTTRTADWHPNVEEHYAAVTELVPLGRLGRPEDLAPAVVFFASEEAGYITGQELFVNGGSFPTVRGG